MSELPDFDKMSVLQLRKACELRDLETTGLKKDLLARLKAHQADGRPKNLGRQKFQFGFMKMLSMKTVVIYPFKPEIFQNDVFMTYFEKAVNYTIKNTKWAKQSAMILEYHDLDEGDEAWADIHRALADDEELTVEHPDFHADSSFWSHRIDTSIDWMVNLCVMKELEFRDQFTKRCLLFENVPEDVTHAELVEEFPEARNLVLFDFDPETPGMVGVELFSERKAEEFMEKYKDYEFKGQKLSLDFYNVRFNRFDKNVKRYRKEHPAKPHDPLTDEERLGKVKEYLELNAEKRKVNSSYELSGWEKIKKCQEISEVQIPIARHLFADASRRNDKGLKIPEPFNEQTAMVRNLMEGKIDQRKGRAAAGNKIAVERERKERERLLQGIKREVGNNPAKRPSSGGSALTGYPPIKKLQVGNAGGMGINRGGRAAGLKGREMARGRMGRMDYGARADREIGLIGMDGLFGPMDRDMIPRDRDASSGWGLERGFGGVDRSARGVDRGMEGFGGGAREMESRMGGMDHGIERIHRSSRGMDRGIGGMGRGMSGMDRSIGGMDRGIGGMDRSIGGMDHGIGGMDHGIGGMGRGIGGMDRGIGGMDRSIGGMGRGMSGMDRSIGGMDRGIGGMDRSIGGMGRGISGMGRGMEELDDGLDAGMGDMSRGLGAVSRTVQALTDKVRELEMLAGRTGSSGRGLDSPSSSYHPRAGFGHRGHSAGPARRW